MSPLHAVILAGGKGTRLRPYTTTIPKPLVPIGDEAAILEIVLRQLAHNGFRRVTIDYATEDRPLSTMGPVVAILDRLPERFIVLNGDILTDLRYSDLLAAHENSTAPLTIATYRRQVEVDFGVLTVEAGRVVGVADETVRRAQRQVVERAGGGHAYAVSRSTLASYPRGEALGFDRLVLDLLAAGQPPASYEFDGFWLDIGRPEDYDRANAEFAGLRSQLLPDK